MELKEKLKKARNDKSISQQALADAIFVSRSAVAKWESGLGVPCAESMAALEKYFEVESGYFMTDKPDEVIVNKNIKMRKATIVCAVLASVIVSVLIAVAFVYNYFWVPPKTVAGQTFIYYREIPTYDDKTFRTQYIIDIWEDGSFCYMPGFHSSYIFDGTWEINGDYIILTDHLDEKKYALKIEDHELIFDQSLSEGSFRVDDGTEFKRKGLFEAVGWPFG